MSMLDLIEMVCYWTAIAQELDENGGSARGWADAVMETKFKFGDDQKVVIYDIISVLELRFAE